MKTNACQKSLERKCYKFQLHRTRIWSPITYAVAGAPPDRSDQIRVRPAQLPCNIMLVSCDSGRGRGFVIITMYNIGNIATDYGDPTTGGIKCRTRHNGSHQSRAERRLHVLCCLPRLLLTQPSTFFWVASHCPHRQVQ